MTQPALSIPVDRGSPVPLYYQVAQYLERAVLSGDLPAGTRLDNEIQLADDLGLSRPTVRQAIRYLVDKGLLVRKRGVGTLVVGSQVKRTVELTSLFDDLRKDGQEPTTHVLSNSVTPAPDPITEALGLPPGTPVWTLERLRYAHGEPLALMRNYLPAHIASFPTERLERHGLYELLRGAGVHLRIASQTISAKKASAAEARVLDEPRGAPLLTMRRTAFDDVGRSVEFGSHIYRASRYSFEITLVSR